jgi:N-acetylglutamate synthase
MLEERLVNVWPAITTLVMDGWVVRLANGYSGRANSASAIAVGAGMNGALLDHIESIYVAEGLVPKVRLTPVADPSTESFLLGRGYYIDDESQTMIAALAPFKNRGMDERIAFEDRPSRAWLEGVCAMQQPSKRSPEFLEAIVGRLKVSAAFATIHNSALPAGFAIGAIDRGWAEIGSVMIDQTHRRKGLGDAIVTALLTWAAQTGAHDAFLQVDAANNVAIRLYEKLGFHTVYHYKYLVKADGP